MKGDAPFELGGLEARVLLAATLVNAGATAMVYDAGGALHVAYYDTAERVLKYAARSAGGAWDPAVVVDATPYAGGELSIALDAAGRPAVAYYEGTNRDLRFAQKGRKGWAVQTIDSAGTVGHNPSLAFTADGFPLVSYYAASTADLRLASFNGTRWYVTTIDAGGSVGRFSDIAISPADGAWGIAYESQSDRTIRYAQKWGKSFTTRVIDSMGGGAEWLAEPSLAFNSTGNPFVSYVDGAAEDLVLNRAGRKSWTRTTPVHGNLMSSDTTIFVDPAANAVRLLYTRAGQFEIGSETPGGAWLTANPVASMPLSAAASSGDRVGLLNASGAVTTVRGDLALSAPDLALTIDAAVADRVELSWTGVPADATFVTIERCLVGESQFTLLATVSAGVTSHWMDAGVTEGLAYVYRLRAGNDVMPAMATATAERADLPPAFGGILLANGFSGVAIEWWDGSDHEVGYRVERSGDGGGHYEVLAESFQWTGWGGYYDVTAAEGTAYTYRVTAVGVYADAAPAVATITSDLWTPFQVAATVVSPTQVHLTWADNSRHEDWFEIDVATEVDDGLPMDNRPLTYLAANTTEYDVSGLTPGKTYWFNLHSSVGQTRWTPITDGVNMVRVDVPLAMPGLAPADLRATATEHVVHLAWTDRTSDETGWRVERSEDGGVTYTAVADLPADSQSFDDGSLPPGHPYTYRVFAVKDGVSDEAVTIMASTAPVPPVLTSGFALWRDLIKLTWEPVQGDVESLEIQYRSPVDGQVHVMASGVDPSWTLARIGGLEGGKRFGGLTYTMWLVAVGPNGSTAGNEITVDTSTGSLGLAGAATGPTSVQLNWANVYDNDTTVYDLWWSVDGVNYARYTSTTATSLSVTGLGPDTAYWFKLRLLSAGGGGTSFADPVSVRTGSAGG